jgi:hypothetical protein
MRSSQIAFNSIEPIDFIMMKSLRNVLTIVVAVMISVCIAHANPPPDNSPQTIAAVGSWRSAPDLLSRYKEADLRSSYANKISFTELSTAVKPVAAPGRSGLQAAHWKNLPSFPTIHTNDVPKNWCGKQALNLDLYAAKNLGEIVTVGVANNAPSDPKAFHVNDYFLASIKVNWQGWKKISIPLNSFTMVRRANVWKPETPFRCGQDSSIGWDRVSGLYLFSKIFNYQPHPSSEFYIGKVFLGKAGGKVPSIVSFADYPLQYKSSSGVEIKGVEGELFNPSSPRTRWWNHPASEIKTDAPLQLPLRFGSYFRHERALLNYFPRYEPGYVNFTPQGVPTIFAGGNAIQYAGRGGKWQVIDLADTIATYAKQKLAYSKVSMHSGGHIEDSTIRFDNDGDIYALAWISDGGTKRDGLLLHKSAKRKDWDIYQLPYNLARFEKFVGHNNNALAHPPVIYTTPREAPTSAYLILPEKQPNGTLTLGEKQLVCEKCMETIPHSGAGTQILSDGDDVYAVYGVPIFNLDKNDPIYKRGLPTYITKYSRQSKKFDTPVLVGYGGTNAADGHNWAVMAIDSNGILHVIINGHHDPFVYTKSLRPHDITAWTSPQQVGKGTSYLGLVIDRQNTLYGVSRNSENGYYFDLTMHRLRNGGMWETKHLVSPFRNYYHVWFHNLNIDPRSGKLFLSYHSQAIELEIFGDDIEMMLYQRPDFAPQTLNQNGSNKYVQRTVIQGSGSGGHETYELPWDERAILTSSDGGDNWRMALSKDLQAPAGCSIDANLICRR